MKINPARHPRLWDIPPVCRVTGLTQQFWMKIEKKKKRECVEGGAEIQEGLPPHDYQYLSVFRLYTRPPLTSKVWSVKRTHTVSWELHNHARGKHTHAADTLLLSASAPSWQNKIRIRPAQIRDLILICPDVNHNWKPATRGHTQRFNILIKFP